MTAGAAVVVLAGTALPAPAFAQGADLPAEDVAAATSLSPDIVAPADGPALGAVLERVLVLYDPATGAIARRTVRVREAFPGEGLEFLWEPFDGLGLDEDGFASGRGRLGWRIPGTASYDPRALAASYEGTLRRGAPEGEGRLRLRDGSWRDGTWRAGLLEGTGRWSRPDGSLYEGGFRAGLPEGVGVLRAAAGWIYEGPFRAGLPEGAGRLRTPDGVERAVVMEAGIEVPTPGAEGDPLLVQGAGEAARVQISVVSNARMALQQSISYAHYNTGEVLQVFPESQMARDDSLLHVWTGGGRMELPWFFNDMTPEDWQATRAFLDVTLETTDGASVRVSELRLVDDRSTPWLRPMLGTHSESGCIGSRAWFEIVNAGWGAVEEPQLRVSFAAPDDIDWDTEQPTAHSAWFEVPLAGFDEGVTVDLRAILRATGLDMDTLENSRFSCPSLEEAEGCGQTALAGLAQGALAGRIGVGNSDLSTYALGELRYRWRDAGGEVHEATEGFLQHVSLARIETPPMFAEMGGGGAFATPAPDFQEVELPLEGQDLQLVLPLRGNPDLTRTEAHLQLYAPRSSLHLLRVEAALGDGSVASSMPVQLFYLSPRDVSGWQSAIQPQACFLPEEF